MTPAAAGQTSWGSSIRVRPETQRPARSCLQLIPARLPTQFELGAIAKLDFVRLLRFSISTQIPQTRRQFDWNKTIAGALPHKPGMLQVTKRTSSSAT